MIFFRNNELVDTGHVRVHEDLRYRPEVKAAWLLKGTQIHFDKAEELVKYAVDNKIKKYSVQLVWYK